MNVRKILQVSFLGILFIGCESRACQQSNDLRWLLFSADRSANVGHLGIFYDPQYLIPAGFNSDLSRFRSNNPTQQKIVIDYVVNKQVEKIDYVYSGCSQAERKNLFSLLESTDISKRGLVLYYTITADPKDYIDEIRNIRETGWSVVAMCHEQYIAEKIDKAFTDFNKNVLITPKKTYFSSFCNTLFLWRNVLLLGGICIACWACNKYGYR